jgi:hypothetical protein
LIIAFITRVPRLGTSICYLRLKVNECGAARRFEVLKRFNSDCSDDGVNRSRRETLWPKHSRETEINYDRQEGKVNQTAKLDDQIPDLPQATKTRDL